MKHLTPLRIYSCIMIIMSLLMTVFCFELHRGGYLETLPKIVFIGGITAMCWLVGLMTWHWSKPESIRSKADMDRPE